MSSHERKYDKGFYVDFSFTYYLHSDDENRMEVINIPFSIKVGNSLAQAYDSYVFIWTHNINIPGMEYIRLQLVDSDGKGIILSRRTPEGQGDW